MPRGVPFIRNAMLGACRPQPSHEQRAWRRHRPLRGEFQVGSFASADSNSTAIPLKAPRMAIHRIACAILLIMLAGCATTGAGGTVHPQLPDIPPEARAACARPTAHVGDDLGVLAARWKATAVCEGGKRASIIVLYDTLRTGLSQ